MEDRKEKAGLYCPDCRTWNLEPANYCSDCGAPLTPDMSPGKGGGRRVFAWLAFFLFGFGLGYVVHSRLGPEEKGPEVTIREKAEIVQNSEDTRDMPPRAPEIEVSAVKENEKEKGTPAPSGPLQFSTGRVSVENRWGREVSSLSAALLGGYWVALPVRAILGGERLTIHFGKHKAHSIEKGIWEEGDTVSLWKVEDARRLGGPILRPWKDGVPLKWVSLTSRGTSMPVIVQPGVTQGSFIECSMTEDFQEYGLFLQQNAVVGWTFGPWLKGGFLWAGPEGERLDDQTTIENFYIISFGSGREEQFSRALSPGERTTPLERLTALADGFRLSPKLNPKETPDELRRESVLIVMEELSDGLIKDGAASQVARVLDDQILMETSDPLLLALAMAANAEAYGYERAIDLAEGVGEAIVLKQEEGVREVERLHGELYARWIRDLLDRKETGRAWQIYERGKDYFRNDPEIHLLGVEAALAGGDWETAERLLRLMDYPDNLADKAKLLDSRISRLKSEVGKIVINFPPGSRQIPVTAVLNETHHQEFVIDTGASMIAIPSSSLKSLDIKLDSRNPVRRVSGIGGVRSAREVRLSSINLGGWIVYDVPALVIDLPGKSNMGLLGLNYLNRFYMEIDQERGVLSLKPR